MLQFNVEIQENYSRSQLLLRTFFGWIYIMIPHLFLLSFIMIAAAVLQIITFWIIMFTGKFPKEWFDFQVRAMRWDARVNSTILNFRDEYPEFGMSAEQAGVDLQVPYQEQVSRSSVLIRALFGGLYVAIPHGFCLFFRIIATQVLVVFAFFTVLFTKKYPADWHKFNIGTLRWNYRVIAYLRYLTHDYPAFSGKE
jgi:hypothetical protein